MREHFHVPDHYFLSHSVGCLPRHAQAAAENRFFASWQSGESWQLWMTPLEAFRENIAGLLGVTADEICPQVNISSGLTKILHSLPSREGRQEILFSDQDFPTNGFVFQQTKTLGFTPTCLRGDPCDLEVWREAITPQTSVVHITHALSNTSHLLPVAEIAAMARQAGAITIVDAAQACGVVPVTPKAWGVDFLLGSGVKFLCAGPGACFLYARQDILPQCAPVDVGWFSHENPFEMDIHQFRFAACAMRFFGGTPSPLPFVLANEALRQWEDIGWDKVRAHIENQLDSLCAAIPPDALISPALRGQRGGTCVVSPSKRDTLRDALLQASIMHDERPAGFRFSVHGYTPAQDVQDLAGLLRAKLTD